MEILLSKAEIRRRIQAIVGMSANASSVVQVQDQMNEFINEAVDETVLRRKWTRQISSIRITIGIDQISVPFPANWGPESIVEAGVWDTSANLYIPIPRKRITLIRSTDPLRDPGADPALELQRQGQPVMFDPGPNGVINIWPPADKAYEIKFSGYPNPQLVNDSDVSCVDARLIILWGAACYLDTLQDFQLAQIQRQKFEARVKSLHAWQQTGESIAIDSEATFDDARFDFGAIPRYDFSTGRAAGI